MRFIAYPAAIHGGERVSQALQDASSVERGKVGGECALATDIGGAAVRAAAEGIHSVKGAGDHFASE
jgi:hypothetical protein